MKRILPILAVLALMLGLYACTKDQSTWQEQYDLGLQYLKEDNSKEAIRAFTAAIKIDRRQALAYVGRGDAYVRAYVLSGETEDYLTPAQADYEKAIKLDSQLAEAYYGLSGVYFRMGDMARAMSVLSQLAEATRQ